MKKLKFKCTLESDVVINQNSASEGMQSTLDFIPGSNFLGICASQLYKQDSGLSSSELLQIFHSGKVRFGDAHIGKDKQRSIRIPAAFFYPKGKKLENEAYIHHRIQKFEQLLEKQLKQARTGFYTFNDADLLAEEIGIETTFAIKSAHDRESRASKDSQMYGYESMRKGAIFYFEIELDSSVEAFGEQIKKSILGCGKKVGRSRTAQYGLVNIEECDFTSIQGNEDAQEFHEVYADGRLIFLDQFGMVCLQPTAEDLGFVEGSEICWDKSQIRTFQYAPWNFKRQARDTDRCGIEKGSMFIVKGSKKSKNTEAYIGSYNNEGFGKVIYNPSFLKTDAKENGKAVYHFRKLDDINIKVANLPELDAKEKLFIELLAQRNNYINIDKDIYKRVNEFVNLNKKQFNAVTFSSQWGSIRKIAMRYRGDELIDALVTINGGNKDDAYLEHGVAADKWKKNGRINRFKAFIKDLQENNIPKDYYHLYLINLAAEMAKKQETNGRH